MPTSRIRPSLLKHGRNAGRSRRGLAVLRLVAFVAGLLGAASLGAAEAERVVLALPAGPAGFHLAGYYAAQEQGYFRDENLEVELYRPTGRSTVGGMLVAGQAQYGIGNARLLTTRLSGGPIRLVAGIMQRSSTALLIRNGSGINSPADLRGHRVALSLAEQSVEVLTMLRAAGLSLSDLQVVEVSGGGPVVFDGAIDAREVTMDVPLASPRNFDPSVRHFYQENFGIDYFYGDSLYVTETEAEQNPQRVQAMRRAVLRGWNYVLGDRQAGIELILALHPETMRADLMQVLAVQADRLVPRIKPGLIEVGYVNVERWQRAAQAAVDLGLAPDLKRLDGFFFDASGQPGVNWFPWLAGFVAVGSLVVALVGFINLQLRRKVEQRTAELRAVEERWRLAVQGINDGIWDADLLRNTIHLSDRCLEMLGFGPGEISPTRSEWLARIHPEDEPAREAAMQAHLHGETTHYQAEFRMLCKDGTHRWIQSRGRMICDAQGRPRRAVGSHSDIHIRKLAEQALRENEKQYRLLFESNPHPIVVFDSESLSFVAVNEAALRLYGYTREEFLGLKITDIRPEEDVPLIMDVLRAQQENPVQAATNFGVWRHRVRDGSIIHVEITGRGLDLPKANCVIAFVRDVTQERRTQQSILESEERYRLLFERCPVAIFECDFRLLQGWLERLRTAGVTDLDSYLREHPEILAQAHSHVRITGINDESIRLMRGTSKEQVISRTVLVDTPDSFEACRKLCLAVWEGRREQEGEMSLRTFDGVLVRVYYRWWLPAVGNRLDYGGTQIVFLDVTGIKRAEAALAAERERLRVTLASMSEGVVTVDVSGAIQFLNRAAVELTGCNAELAVGRRIGDVCVLREERTRGPARVSFLDVFTAGGDFTLPAGTGILHQDGTLRVIDGRCAPMHDTAGNVIGAVFVFRDITERARLEAELLRSSKLESVGVLAGGIAHDFNNILTIVMGNLALALLDETVQAAAGKHLREAERGALRARELTQQLLTFAKGGDPVRSVVAISEVIQEAADFALHGSKVKCEYSFANDTWPAEVDAGQIGQVVQNLVINAVQAMPEGGILHIGVRNDVVDAGARPPFAGGNAVRLTIEDTGSGIRPEHLDRIFDPYFTTKQQGSGLGLATVYSIVRKHQGHIEVESTLGVGTVFRVWLPAARVAPPAPRESTSPFAPLKGRVLFMDDEEPIRDMADALLRQLGLETTMVADGAEAVRAFAQAQVDNRPYDAVVMDLTVPGGMGGREAVQALLEIDPQARVIVSSGYSSDPIMSDYRAHGFQGCVAKPYRIRDLARELRRLINESPRSRG